MDEIISYKMCAVKVRNAKLRNYLKFLLGITWIYYTRTATVLSQTSMYIN